MGMKHLMSDTEEVHSKSSQELSSFSTTPTFHTTAFTIKMITQSAAVSNSIHDAYKFLISFRIIYYLFSTMYSYSFSLRWIFISMSLMTSDWTYFALHSQ